MAKSRCHECGLDYEKGVEIDPCIGRVPGAYSACCGHGNIEHASILFGSKPGECEIKTTGQAALDAFERLRAAGYWDRFHTGGVVQAPRLNLIGETGPETVE